MVTWCSTPHNSCRIRNCEVIKALPSRSLEKLHGGYQDHLYWTNPTVVHDKWSTAILQLLHKGKGDSTNLKNYRGIVLQDYSARLMSVIINIRLTTLLEEAHRLDKQFRFSPGKGCIDATIYAMRTALQLRREHQMPSYVLFMDPIKAFDTANHDLLFTLAIRSPRGTRRRHPTSTHRFQTQVHLVKTLEAIIDYYVGVRH
jgi:hypothetical protein